MSKPLKRIVSFVLVAGLIVNSFMVDTRTAQPSVRIAATPQFGEQALSSRALSNRPKSLFDKPDPLTFSAEFQYLRVPETRSLLRLRKIAAWLPIPPLRHWILKDVDDIIKLDQTLDVLLESKPLGLSSCLK